MKLSVVIPVYNEGYNIKKVLQGLKLVLDKIHHEVLLVYDFATDTTIKPVRLLKKNYSSLKLVKNQYGKGALNAIKTGLQKASGDSVLVTMADCSDDPTTIPLMLQAFDQGFDIICGSRYMPGGRKIGGPLIKSFLSWLAGISGKYLLGLPTHDLTNSFKLYRKTLLEKINIESRGGFELGMEILVKGYFLHQAKVTEVPTIWYDRTDGQSRFRLLSWLPRYIYWYLWALKKRLF